MRASARSSLVRPMELARLRALAVESQALDLAVGIPHRDPPRSAIEAAATALGDGRNQYTEPAGLPALRAAIAADRTALTGVAVDPVEEVTVTCGAIEAMLVALLGVTDPGDEVLIPEPYYESYPGIVALAGAVPRPVPLTVGDWRLDLDALRRAVTARTRAVILNTPHNPTGRVFDADEVGALLRLCAEHDLVCITDEVYDHYVFGGRKFVSGWNEPGSRDRVIVTGGLSKTLRMTGWRIGYCVARPAMTEVLRRVHERTTIGAPTPLQYGASVLGNEETQDGFDLAPLSALLVERLRGLGFEVRPPEGGWFLLAGIARPDSKASELSVELVQRAGVLLAPGTPFFSDPATGERWLRVTFMREPATLSAGLDRLQMFLKEELEERRG